VLARRAAKDLDGLPAVRHVQDVRDVSAVREDRHSGPREQLGLLADRKVLQDATPFGHMSTHVTNVVRT